MLTPGTGSNPSVHNFPPPKKYQSIAGPEDIGDLPFPAQNILTESLYIDYTIIRVNPDLPGLPSLPPEARIFTIKLNLPATSSKSFAAILPENILLPFDNESDFLFRLILMPNPDTGPIHEIETIPIIGNPDHVSIAPWLAEWGLALSVLGEGKLFSRFRFG